MDENILIQFLKQAEKVSLSKAAKKSGRERLLSVIGRTRGVSDTSFEVFGHGIFSNFFHMRRTVLAGTLAGILVITTSIGTSLAAEKSLPGGVLYPIKTNINESVFGSLAFSDQAKIKWQMKRIERRIAEADELATEGRLNEGTAQDIENLASKQMQDMDDLVQKLEDNNDERALTTKEQLNSTLKSGRLVSVEVSDQKVTIRERHEDKEDREDSSHSVELEEESGDGSLERDNEKDDDKERSVLNESVLMNKQASKETTQEGDRKKSKNATVSSQDKNTENTSAKSSSETEKKQEISNNNKSSESSSDDSEENNDADQEDSSGDESETTDVSE